MNWSQIDNVSAIRTILLGVFFCITTTANCQSDSAEIVGSYYMSSGNPEGGSHFIVMPDHTFVVTYFGGMRKGTWELQDDRYFFTYHVEPVFVLYARNNPKVTDSVSVRIAIDGNRSFALRLNASGDEPFTPLFNKNANCFDYPYILKQKEALKNLDAYAPDRGYRSQNELEDLGEQYSFNTEIQHNEFILAGLSREYSTPRSFSATFANNSMVLNDSKTIEKSGEIEDMNAEDMQFVKQFIETELFPKQLVYGNEFFPHYDSPTETNIQPYVRIEAKLTSLQHIVIQEKSLFLANCEDDD